MNFSTSIPESLQTDEQVKKFIQVLDLTNKYKEIELNKFVDGFNKKIVRGKDFLTTKLLSELGLGVLPAFLNKWQLDALYINSTNILKWRGSYQGLELWLWCLTAGYVYIDPSALYPNSNYIRPSDLIYGFISNVFPVNTQTLYLFSDSDDFGNTYLYIELDSPFLNDPQLETYITDNVHRFLGFTSINLSITIDFFPGSFAPIANSNKFFSTQ